MGDLLQHMGKEEPRREDRRSRLVEAVRYGQAVGVLAEADRLAEGDATALREDADAEIAAAVRSCVEATKSPAEIRRDRRAA